MAAPILWTRGKMAFFLQENRHVHKIPRFRGGMLGLGGGGKCRFYSYGRGNFSEQKQIFGAQGAMMDTHALSLTACAWQLLCDMPSAQGNGIGVGTPQWDRTCHSDAAYPQILCTFLHDSGMPIFETLKRRRKICGKSAQISSSRFLGKARRKNPPKIIKIFDFQRSQVTTVHKIIT